MEPTFREVDQALYDLERPAYRYWAQGAGSDPTKNPAWVAKRKMLTTEWHRLCPWPARPTIEKKSWLVRTLEKLFTKE